MHLTRGTVLTFWGFYIFFFLAWALSFCLLCLAIFSFVFLSINSLILFSNTWLGLLQFRVNSEVHVFREVLKRRDFFSISVSCVWLHVWDQYMCKWCSFHHCGHCCQHAWPSCNSCFNVHAPRIVSMALLCFTYSARMHFCFGAFHPSGLFDKSCYPWYQTSLAHLSWNLNRVHDFLYQHVIGNAEIGGLVFIWALIGVYSTSSAGWWHQSDILSSWLVPPMLCLSLMLVPSFC